MSIKDKLKQAVKRGDTCFTLIHEIVGDEGAIALAYALKDPNCKLTSLNLENNNIGAEGAIALADALKDPNCKLTSLNLENNNIGAEGARALADALRYPNCKLTSLDITKNNIGAEGAIALADALKDPNCKLTSLNLTVNNIGDEGAIALANALKDPNCKLTSLNLTMNNIGAESGRALADALRYPNCKLTHLNINCNCIGADGVRALTDTLKDPNCKLISLHFIMKNIRAESANEIIGSSLQNNYRILNMNAKDGSPNQAYIARNLNLFVSNCNKILAGKRLSPKTEAMLLDQCNTIIRNKLHTIGSIEEVPAQNVIDKLTTKFYTKLFKNHIPIMPTVLHDIMVGYCIEGDFTASDHYNFISQEGYKSFLTRTAISVVPVMLSSLPIICAYPAMTTFVAISSICLLFGVKNFSHQLHSLYERLEEELERQDDASLNSYKLKIGAPIVLALSTFYTLYGMYGMAALTVLSTVPCLISVLNLDDSPKMPTVVNNLYKNYYEIVEMAVEKSGFIDRYKPGNSNLPQLVSALG